MIQQITIVGTGLIGGSLGLALKEARFAARIVGCDRPEVLARACELGAIDSGESVPEAAVLGSDVIVLATPVLAILDLMAKIGPAMSNEALLTDTGSTKLEIVRRARTVFGNDAIRRFLPGHPMAGKERGGIEQAEAELFRGATWVLTPEAATQAMVSPEFTRGKRGEWIALLESIGARVVVLDPERHDRMCAYTSHLPQMVSTAIASTVVDQTANDASIAALAGGGIRGMVRLAAGDYSMWRDIALTNTKNLQDALLQLEQKLAHIRENLKTRQLQAEFDRAHELDLDTPYGERKTKDDTDPPRLW
jgi:prephenate dehydrogenase